MQRHNEEMKEKIDELSSAVQTIAKVSKGKRSSALTNTSTNNLTNNLTNNSTNNSHNTNNTNNSHNSLTNNTNIQNQNNFMFNFGEEDISKIPEDVKLKALKSLSNSIYKFIELVNLNNDFPENQTVLFNNIRSDTGHVLKNKQLIAKNQNAIIEDLINFRTEEMQQLAEQFYDENKLTKTEYNDVKELINFLQTAYIETEDVDGNIVKGDKETVKKLKKVYKTIKELLYNGRLIVGPNIKKFLTESGAKPILNIIEDNSSEYFSDC